MSPRKKKVKFHVNQRRALLIQEYLESQLEVKAKIQIVDLPKGTFVLMTFPGDRGICSLQMEQEGWNYLWARKADSPDFAADFHKFCCDISTAFYRRFWKFLPNDHYARDFFEEA